MAELTWVAKTNNHGDIIHEAESKAINGAYYIVQPWFNDRYLPMGVMAGLTRRWHSCQTVIEAKAACQSREDACQRHEDALAEGGD